MRFIAASVRNGEVMTMEMERVAWKQVLFKGIDAPSKVPGGWADARADADPSVTDYRFTLKTTPSVRGGASVTYVTSEPGSAAP